MPTTGNQHRIFADREPQLAEGACPFIVTSLSCLQRIVPALGAGEQNPAYLPRTFKMQRVVVGNVSLIDHFTPRRARLATVPGEYPQRYGDPTIPG